MDTWDGQLVLASMVSGQWTATSNRNLIRNIGFDELATHTFEDRGELQPVMPMPTPTALFPWLSTRERTIGLAGTTSTQRARNGASGLPVR